MKNEIEYVNKRRGGRKILFGAVSVFIAVWCFTLMYPLFWAFQQSLKTPFEYFTSGSLEWAEESQWENYVRIFEELKVTVNRRKITFLEMLWNTIWRTFGAVTLGIFATSTVAYCLARYQFGARPIMWGVIVFMIVYPSMGTGGAAYKQALDMGIHDSPLQLIKVLGGYSGTAFFIIYSFYQTLPKDYSDAATIDGAGDFTVYLRIMLPMALGPIMAMYAVQWISTWNDTTAVLLYYPSYPTLPAGLYVYQNKAERAVDYPLFYTGVIITMLPTLTLFALLQNQIMNNVTLGGLKG